MPFKLYIRALDRPDRPIVERTSDTLADFFRAAFEFGHVSDIQCTAHTHKDKIIVRGNTGSVMGPVPILEFRVEEVSGDDSSEGAADTPLVRDAGGAEGP